MSGNSAPPLTLQIHEVDEAATKTSECEPVKKTPKLEQRNAIGFWGEDWYKVAIMNHPIASRIKTGSILCFKGYQIRTDIITVNVDTEVSFPAVVKTEQPEAKKPELGDFCGTVLQNAQGTSTSADSTDIIKIEECRLFKDGSHDKTLMGRVIDVGSISNVPTVGGTFPCRNIRIFDGDTSVLYGLWRDASNTKVEHGDYCVVKHCYIRPAGKEQTDYLRSTGGSIKFVRPTNWIEAEIALPEEEKAKVMRQEGKDKMKIVQVLLGSRSGVYPSCAMPSCKFKKLVDGTCVNIPCSKPYKNNEGAKQGIRIAVIIKDLKTDEELSGIIFRPQADEIFNLPDEYCPDFSIYDIMDQVSEITAREFHYERTGQKKDVFNIL